MYRVTVFLNDGNRIIKTTEYAWCDDFCDKLNNARRDAFVSLGGVLVQPEDVSCIKIDRIPEGVPGYDLDSGCGKCASGSNCDCANDIDNDIGRKE